MICAGASLPMWILDGEGSVSSSSEGGTTCASVSVFTHPLLTSCSSEQCTSLNADCPLIFTNFHQRLFHSILCKERKEVGAAFSTLGKIPHKKTRQHSRRRRSRSKIVSFSFPHFFLPRFSAKLAALGWYGMIRRLCRFFFSLSSYFLSHLGVKLFLLFFSFSKVKRKAFFLRKLGMFSRVSPQPLTCCVLLF